jgi:hypothetical protein
MAAGSGSSWSDSQAQPLTSIADSTLGTNHDAARANEARNPSRLLATAEEWRYRLSRPKLRAGRAVIQLFNRGEDVHDLRLRRVGRTRQIGTPEIAPGNTALVRTKLRKGRYALWCSVPGHRALGMEARLKVRKRR